MRPESWLLRWGYAVRHAALRGGGGELVQYVRAGLDPYPLVGWKKLELSEGGAAVYIGPNGERYDDVQQAYEHEVAARSAETGMSETRLAHTFLQKFLRDCCSESRQTEEDGNRVVVTTSTLEEMSVHVLPAS